MKHLLLLLIVFFTAASAGMAKPAIITGKFLNNAPKSVTIRYLANTDEEMECNWTSQSQDLTKDARFRFVVETSMPLELQMMADENWLFFDKVLLPGDSLHLTFNDNSGKVEGNSELYMEFQFDYNEQFNNKDSVEAYQKAWDLPDAISFAAYRSNILKSRLRFFEDYFRNKEKVPELFRNTYRANEEALFIIDMAQLSWRKPIGQKALYNNAYLDYIKAFDLNNPDYMLSAQYTRLLRELPYGVWSTMRFNADKATADRIIQNEYLIRDSVARVYFKGKTYDHAVYNLLLERVTALSKKVGQPDFDRQYKTADSIMKIVGDKISNKDLYARAVRRLRSLKEARLPAADFSAHDLPGNNVKLSDYKGKVVYIDFWATNCVPCVGEIPYAKKMQERYKNNPDIVLLYVSFDSDNNLLNTFLKKNAFTGTHWVDHKGFASDVANKYGVRSLPHYIVIDKKGMLVTATAQRPSGDPYTLLDQLLKE